LRIHTRLPVVLPERITPELISWLSELKLDPVIVIHMNHPNEMSLEVRYALLKLRQAGIPLLNQTVLLKGINDDDQTLQALSETLFTAGVLPYYLHILDKVQGAAHFDTELSVARHIHTKLTHSLPGYLVPKLVREEFGEHSKTLLSTALYTG